MATSDIDWALSGLLDGISAAGGELTLTVFTGGLAISGTAVPEEVYFRRLDAHDLAEQSIRDREERLRLLAEVNAALEREDVTDAERRALESQGEELERRFIVMVDVTVFGAGALPLKAPTWRGRLSQLSGWTFGTFANADCADEPDASDQPGAER